MSGSQLGTYIRLFKVERHWDKDAASGRGRQSLSPSKSYVSGIQPAHSGPHAIFMTPWISAIKCPLWQWNWFFVSTLQQSVVIQRRPARHKHVVCLQPGVSYTMHNDHGGGTVVVQVVIQSCLVMLWNQWYHFISPSRAQFQLLLPSMLLVCHAEG